LRLPDRKQAAASTRRRRSARRALARLASLPVPVPESLQITADDTSETRRRKHIAAYAFYVVTAAVAILVALAVWVFPTKTWLSQRHETASAANKLTVLQQQASALEQQVLALDTDAEIEKVARERYNLIRPGEKAFVMLPASLPQFPDVVGYNVVQAILTLAR
jgi:cell division protein FtsB